MLNITLILSLIINVTNPINFTNNHVREIKGVILNYNYIKGYKNTDCQTEEKTPSRGTINNLNYLKLGKILVDCSA